MKGKRKTAMTLRWHDYMQENLRKLHYSRETNNNTVISEFIKATGYKANTQEVIIFLYISNKFKKMKRKAIPFSLASKNIKYLVIF